MINRIIEDIQKFEPYQKELLLNRLSDCADHENKLKKYFMSLKEDKKQLLLSVLFGKYKTYFLKQFEKSNEWQDEDFATSEEFIIKIISEIQAQSPEMEKISLDIYEKARIRRSVMKANYDDWSSLISDQMKGKDVQIQKDYNLNSELIDLPDPKQVALINNSIIDFFINRKSIRNYSLESLNLTELSYLLWSTQGVRSIAKNNLYTLRTVPSSGARHPFETYLYIKNVEGLKKGVYRYIALGHKLLLLSDSEDFENKFYAACDNIKWMQFAAVTFIWSVIPYRSEWRYMDKAAKSITLDAGHIGQNLYLACESIGCGTCTIAGYFQKQMDEALQLDGDDEFVIYLAPVGKKSK